MTPGGYVPPGPEDQIEWSRQLAAAAAKPGDGGQGLVDGQSGAEPVPPADGASQESPSAAVAQNEPTESRSINESTCSSVSDRESSAPDVAPVVDAGRQGEKPSEARPEPPVAKVAASSA